MPSPSEWSEPRLRFFGNLFGIESEKLGLTPEPMVRLPVAKPLPAPEWGRLELDFAWKRWGTMERESYRDLLERARPLEKASLQAACYAARVTAEHFAKKWGIGIETLLPRLPAGPPVALSSALDDPKQLSIAA